MQRQFIKKSRHLAESTSILSVAQAYPVTQPLSSAWNHIISRYCIQKLASPVIGVAEASNTFHPTCDISEVMLVGGKCSLPDTLRLWLKSGLAFASLRSMQSVSLGYLNWDVDLNTMLAKTRTDLSFSSCSCTSQKSSPVNNIHSRNTEWYNRRWNVRDHLYVKDNANCIYSIVSVLCVGSYQRT